MTYDIGNPGPVLVQYTLYIINMVFFCRRYYCYHVLATTNYSRHIEDRPTTQYQSFHVNKSFVESPKRKIYISVLLKNAFLFTVSWALNTWVTSPLYLIKQHNLTKDEIWMLVALSINVSADTLSWLPANQSLLLLLNTACLVDKQQIPIL